MIQQSFNRKEILGYSLRERIGAGGFGEVWSAVAPGGLHKAVKIVYGFHDEKHAQAELKALDRVKQLRHPFLLSLERIEIFEGQLVVVTELADKSMADLFNDYLMKGETGIPRDKLVKYIRCAAEGLDYLTEEHGLQHLDVKPENLLIISEHVKVADFGLIKDLQQSNQSLMSGMTPTYAAPELFDGRPGSKCDQYSLAIVYQEMLTGVNPFPGTTPAQLAAQHLNGKPNLRPLDTHDQAIIAKALAKDPDHRFGSCLEMVEELANKKRKSTKKAIRRTQFGRDSAKSDTCTMVVGEQISGTQIVSSSSLPFQSAEIKMRPPVELGDTKPTFSPLVVIGLGASANQAVVKFKKHLVKRHGNSVATGAIQILCMDVDRNEVSELLRDQSEGRLAPTEVLDTPLRKAEVYRERGRGHLSWLSRRWIYNIPRSLQTEGLRPLGRLAFADHFESICNKIQDKIAQAIRPEHLAHTSDLLAMDPGEVQPRVILVSSVSGGTGSGMGLDVAYTIKLLLHEAGLNSEALTGIFLHSTYQRQRDAGIASANALAFLTEYRHFVEFGYPGDDSLGIPEFDSEPPVDHFYFNYLGSDLSQSQFDEQLDKVAEYIYASSCIPCSRFFDKCRESDEEIEHMAVRTFGISLTGPGRRGGKSDIAGDVSKGLVRKWCHEQTEEVKLEVEFDHFGKKHAIDPLSVAERLKTVALETYQGSFSGILERAEQCCRVSTADRASKLAHCLNRDFSLPSGTEAASPDVQRMEELVSSEIALGSDRVTKAIYEQLSRNEIRLRDTVQMSKIASAKVANYLQDMVRAERKHKEQGLRELSSIQSLNLSEQTPETTQTLKRLLAEYCNNRLHEFIYGLAQLFYRSLSNAIESTRTILEKCRSAVEFVSTQLPPGEPPQPANYDQGLDIDRLFDEFISLNTNSFIRKTEVQVFESMIREEGGFLAYLSQEDRVKESLAKWILSSAHTVVTHEHERLRFENIVASNGLGPEQLVKWMNRFIMQAQPQYNDCGGSARVLIGIPANSDETFLPSVLNKQFQVKGCTVRGTRGNFLICFEGEDIPLANVAYRLLESRPDAVELIRRIHTRNDVDWSSLDDLI